MTMKHALIAAAILASAVPAYAAETYAIDPGHTIPTYEISHLGFSTQRGRFDATSGTVVLDRAAKTGSVDITIETKSISTGVPKLDQHLRSEDFFNTEKFPTMTFKSDKVNFNGDEVASVDGKLTLLGVTKPVTLMVTNFKCGTHPFYKKEECGADVVATIKRSDFGMTKYVPAVGDTVRLVIPVEAFKQ
jgi:polyisoprenoid-binding protein YceI